MSSVNGSVGDRSWCEAKPRSSPSSRRRAPTRPPARSPKRHGLFTYVFLDALRGGAATLAALLQVLRREVPRRAALQNREQHPWSTHNAAPRAAQAPGFPLR